MLTNLINCYDYVFDLSLFLLVEFLSKFRNLNLSTLCVPSDEGFTWIIGKSCKIDPHNRVYMRKGSANVRTLFVWEKSLIIRSKIELSMGGVDENDARENFIKLPIKQDKSEPMSCNIFCTCEFLMHLTFSHSLSTSFKSKKGIAQTLFH